MLTASAGEQRDDQSQSYGPEDARILQLYRCLNLSSSTSPSNCQDLFNEMLTPSFPLSRVPIILVYILLFFEGVLGNSLVILCVILFRSMRSATNVFLLNLALSDLLVFLICEPSVLTTMLYNRWIYGKFVCKLHACLQGTSVGVSIFTLTGISIERYRMITQPMRRSGGLRRRYLVLWILVIWCVAFTICLPLLFAYEVHRNDPYPGSEVVTTEHCIETWMGSLERRQIFTVVLFVAFYLLPFLLMTVLHVSMSRHLLAQPENLQQTQTSRKLSDNAGGTVRHVRGQRKRISFLLSVLLTLFAVCWIPYHSINLFVDFYYTGEERQQLVGWVVKYAYPTAQFFTFANSAVNPLCTLFCSEKFRKALRQLRHGQCVNQREHSRRELHSRHGFLYQSGRRIAGTYNKPDVTNNNDSNFSAAGQEKIEDKVKVNIEMIPQA